MGWTVKLENEQKEVIEELDREFYFAVTTGSMEFKLLKYLDPYGNACFNCLQMKDLISDMILLQGLKPNPLFKEILRLAERCKEEVHTYLVFYGD